MLRTLVKALCALMEFKITDDIPLIGKPLKEIQFPEGVLLVGVLRYGEMIIPHGESIYSLMIVYSS